MCETRSQARVKYTFFSRCLSALIWSFRFCLNCCYCFGRVAFKQKTTAAARRLLARSRVHFFTPSFVSAFLASANWKLRETNTTRADNVCRCSRTYLNIGVTPNRHPHGDDGMSAAPCLQRNSREVQLSPRLRKKTCLRTLLAKYVNHCTWEGRYDDKSLQTITVFGSDS